MAYRLDPFQNIVNVGWNSTGYLISEEYGTGFPDPQRGFFQVFSSTEGELITIGAFRNAANEPGTEGRLNGQSVSVLETARLVPIPPLDDSIGLILQLQDGAANIGMNRALVIDGYGTFLIDAAIFTAPRTFTWTGVSPLPLGGFPVSLVTLAP